MFRKQQVYSGKYPSWIRLFLVSSVLDGEETRIVLHRELQEISKQALMLSEMRRRKILIENQTYGKSAEKSSISQISYYRCELSM